MHSVSSKKAAFLLGNDKTLVSKIVQTIRQDIDRGNYKKGQRLLSINTFSKQFNVSRDTIEKAYKILKKEGVIKSVAGRGYFVKDVPDSKIKVLLVFNKLSAYKKGIYDQLVLTLGEKAKVDLHIHHYDPDKLQDILEPNLGNYHYYVIMPHFLHKSPKNKCLRILQTIPQDRLILLDKYLPQLPEVQKAVFQDFELDVYEALVQATAILKSYRSITVIFPESHNHPKEINAGIEKFCKAQHLDFNIISSPEDARFAPAKVFIVLTEDDLAVLIMAIRRSGFRLGSDIGVISFNETVLKELLDITVISTDFDEMGRSTANLILQNKDQLIRNPFKFIRRASL